jgi:hypothetical protein
MQQVISAFVILSRKYRVAVIPLAALATGFAIAMPPLHPALQVFGLLTVALLWLAAYFALTGLSQGEGGK